MGIFLLDVNKHLWLSVIRGIFALIDSVVYTLIQILFGCMFNLANFELYGLYEVFEKRIYIILGLFMLFKVVTSMLSYLVSPDKINDKQEGASKLVTRIMISLVMLIMLPTFFSLMTEFQNKALPVIPRVIVGTTGTLNNENVSGVSQSMSSTMLQGFFHLKTEMGCTGTDINDVGDILLHVNDTCSGNNSIYAYDYLPIVSTIVGAAMCYVLFSLCISVAIRAFKLIILRMIAPIPVVSYISPKSSKDGMFATWSKTFISTWAEMFIYLGLIYFIVYIIDFLLSKNAWQGLFNGISDPFSGILLLAFLIIGLLFFARQAPKFIFDALGIKNKGGFTRMLGMGAAAFGAAGSVASSIRARNQYDKDQGKNVHHLRNIGASLFSGIASASAAGNALLSTDKPTLTTGFDAQRKYNAQNINRIESGSTALGRAGSVLSSIFMGQTDYDKNLELKAVYEAANKALLQYKNTIEKKALEKTSRDLVVDITDNKGHVLFSNLNYIDFMAATEGAKNGDINSLKYFEDRGFVTTDANGNTVGDWQGAQSWLDKLKDVQTQRHAKDMVELIKKADGGDKKAETTLFTDYGAQYNDYRNAKDSAKTAKLNVDFSTYGIKNADARNGDKIGIKQALGETNRRVTNIVTDPKFKAAEANAKATKKS